MLKQRNRGHSVLSVYPTKDGYAFVLFEAALSPHDWGHKDIKKDVGCAKAITSIKELMMRYRPDVLVMEDPDEHGTLRSIRAKRIHVGINAIANSLSIDVMVVKRKSVRSTFAMEGALNKQEIARLIGEKLEAFAPLVPKVREAWQTESRRMALFDAASRALTYYYAMEGKNIKR